MEERVDCGTHGISLLAMAVVRYVRADPRKGLSALYRRLEIVFTSFCDFTSYANFHFSAVHILLR